MQIIIHGPQGCGKTRHADLLAQHFHCIEIVDDWIGQTQLPDGALALTNIPAIPLGMLTDMRIMSFAEAMRQAAVQAPVERAVPKDDECSCGNYKCNWNEYRPTYGRSFIPCPLRDSAHNSVNTAASSVESTVSPSSV
jgi:hypothetical protein